MSENYYLISDNDTHMPIRCTMQRFDHLRQHMHDFFEFSMIVSGNCSLQLDDHIYSLKADDVFCVDPLMLHELHGVNCVIVTILFNQSLFTQILPIPSQPRFFCVSTVSEHPEAISELRSLIAHIIKTNIDKKEGYELRNWAYIYKVMDIFYRNFRIKLSTAKEKKNHKYAMRLSEISQIIQQRYTENITLKELADEVHLSVPYLSKFFVEYYGMNFLSYLNQYRLMHAVQELSTTDKNIDEIAIDSGFSSSHAFVSLFKKQYDMLPKEYRKEQKSNKENSHQQIEQHNYIAGLKKYLINDISSNVTTPTADRIIDFSVSGSTIHLINTWKKMMTVGRASDVLISDVHQMLTQLQLAVGFEYIKLCGVFSDDLHVYTEMPNDSPVYSFSYLDKILDFVTDNNLKPWIQLSYMPEKLAKYPNKRLFGSNVSQPNSVASWCQLVLEFLRHIAARYGLDVIKTWKFGLWNQPNTDNNLFGFSKEQDFFEFYKETYICLKGFCNDLEFCLPPTFYIVSDEYENWYLHFLDWCRSNGCVPDSLSFTYYDTKLMNTNNHTKESFGFVYTMSLSESPDGLKDFVMQVLRERRQLKLGNMPIYLSEWNNTPSQQDLLNDTCYKSCYIVKNILENYDRLSSFTYQALTDLMADAALPNKLFFGGLGLFTTNGIPKASYNAYTLLQQLGDEFLGRGDGYFITRKDTSYQIMLYNYQHFNYLYANGERFDMTETDRYTVFTDSEPVTVKCKLSDIPEGHYKVSDTYINRSHGSSFDQWIAMGALEPTTPHEFDLLKKASTPGFHQRLADVTSDGILELNATLDLLEVRLIQIVPLL